jgi:thioredoxin 1
MTDKDIQEKITSCHLILAYFSQPACTVCKTLRPKVETLVAGYQGIEFQYIDTLTCPLLRGQYMIFAVPTILLFYKGKEVKRWSRFLSVREIRAELERYWAEERG